MHMMEGCSYCFPWIFPILIPIVFPMLMYFFFGRRYGWPGPWSNAPGNDYRPGNEARPSAPAEPQPTSTKTSQILDERLARGEISKEEYLELKAMLDK
jgi:hypothetical protein